MGGGINRWVREAGFETAEGFRAYLVSTMPGATLELVQAPGSLIEIDHEIPLATVDLFNPEQRHLAVTSVRLLTRILNRRRGGSFSTNQGAAHGGSKLTEAQALDILAGDGTAAAAARLYGVHESTVNAIRRGTAWKHLQSARTIVGVAK
jgi:hypothetical protein